MYVLLAQATVIGCLLIVSYFLRDLTRGMPSYKVTLILNCLGVALGVVVTLTLDRWRTMRDKGDDH
jgi:hypothetical protein